MLITTGNRDNVAQSSRNKYGLNVVAVIEVSPQATTVPSCRSAKLWTQPPATAKTLLKPAGTFVWPTTLAA